MASSQVLGIGKALELKYISKIFQYNKLSKFHNIFLQKTIKHININDRQQFKPPWPKIIIGCGRKSVPIGRWIKKQSHSKHKDLQRAYMLYIAYLNWRNNNNKKIFANYTNLEKVLQIYHKVSL